MKNFEVCISHEQYTTIKADAFQVTESGPSPLLSFVNIKETTNDSDKASYEVVAVFRNWQAVVELPSASIPVEGINLDDAYDFSGDE